MRFVNFNWIWSRWQFNSFFTFLEQLKKESDTERLLLCLCAVLSQWRLIPNWIEIFVQIPFDSSDRSMSTHFHVLDTHTMTHTFSPNLECIAVFLIVFRVAIDMTLRSNARWRYSQLAFAMIFLKHYLTKKDHTFFISFNFSLFFSSNRFISSAFLQNWIQISFNLMTHFSKMCIRTVRSTCLYMSTHTNLTSLFRYML